MKKKKILLNLQEQVIFEAPTILNIQLTIANNFISSIDNDEEHAMYSKSDNIEIMINDEADKVIKAFYNQLKVDINIIQNQ